MQVILIKTCCASCLQAPSPAVAYNGQQPQLLRGELGTQEYLWEQRNICSHSQSCFPGDTEAAATPCRLPVLPDPARPHHAGCLPRDGAGEPLKIKSLWLSEVCSQTPPNTTESRCTQAEAAKIHLWTQSSPRPPWQQFHTRMGDQRGLQLCSQVIKGLFICSQVQVENAARD